MYRAIDSFPRWRSYFYFITLIFFLAWLVQVRVSLSLELNVILCYSMTLSFFLKSSRCGFRGKQTSKKFCFISITLLSTDKTVSPCWYNVISILHKEFLESNSQGKSFGHYFSLSLTPSVSVFFHRMCSLQSSLRHLLRSECSFSRCGGQGAVPLLLLQHRWSNPIHSQPSWNPVSRQFTLIWRVSWAPVFF